jgi:predicted nucleotidyltransferase component of viral defense system
MLEASMDNLRQAIKIDISTGDVITPHAVEYSYHLMFEDRYISLLTYNLETLLAEKMETIMSRATANTRMRDFYDIYVISRQKSFDQDVLKDAFYATSEKRDTVVQIPDFIDIISSIESDEVMKSQWENFKNDSFFVNELSWTEVIESVKDLAAIII